MRLIEFRFLEIFKLTLLGQEHTIKRKQGKKVEGRPAKVLKTSPGIIFAYLSQRYLQQ
jgi:hypothetical protein